MKKLKEPFKITSIIPYIVIVIIAILIAFIAPVEYKIVQPIMSIIDDNVKQRELWTIEA